jgi:hypothetical protein
MNDTKKDGSPNILIPSPAERTVVTINPCEQRMFTRCLGCGHMIEVSDGIQCGCPGVTFRECLIKLARAIYDDMSRSEYPAIVGAAEDVLKMLKEQG